MKRIDITNKSISLLVALGVVFAILEKNIVFLSPIITIAIPYKFIKNKSNSKYSENKKILNDLFLFNIIVFIGSCIITKNISQELIDNITNIVVAFIYFKVIYLLEKKSEQNSNPKILYDKLMKTIYTLETMSTKMEEELRGTTNEKSKRNIQTKLDVIQQQLKQCKNQLEIVKTKIELDSKKVDH